MYMDNKRGFPEILDVAVTDRSHKHLSCPTIYVDQTLAGSSRADEGFAGTLDSEVKATAPGNRHIAVNFKDVILEGDRHQFFLGAGGFETYYAIAIDAKIE